MIKPSIESMHAPRVRPQKRMKLNEMGCNRTPAQMACINNKDRTTYEDASKCKRLMDYNGDRVHQEMSISGL